MMVKPGEIHIQEDVRYGSSPLTIEKRLHYYESHPDKSARSAVLWHAWNQNKAWLTRLLELTLASFPSYSRHDASHAEAVLHNIERVLGENRIAELSATDCFAILHTVYIHDIGMSILAEDRKKIVRSDEFIEMIDELADGVDNDLKDAAIQLKQPVHRIEEDSADEDFDGMDYHRKKGDLYGDKLSTYYAIVLLIANFQRKHHGEKVAADVRDWVSDPRKLGAEFAMSGIPMRIFLRIADCAALHTDWEFNHILALPFEENGYENDMLHPRFVAVMLQIGDALDIDNDRFHPFAEAFLGGLPDDSEAHYDKHLSIRTLKITPEEIVIEANCRTREALHLVKNECDNLNDLLRNASYNWTNIAPPGFSGALPSFQLKSLRLRDIEIPMELAMTRFQISQSKAFSLLQGRNIYSSEFPFARELLQNAIDSTKIQCYRDYMTSSKFRYQNSEDGRTLPSIANISKIINPLEYPIRITMECCRQIKGEEPKEISFDELPQSEEDEEKYGILFSIEDYGTGIDKDTISAISDVGSSYRNRKKLMREMPDWLRPTGEFGIGLQSVFLVNDRFACETYVRNGERYRIEFLTGAKGEKGYINVNPKDPAKYPMSYGTKFEVFIPHDKRKEHGEYTDTMVGAGKNADVLCRYDPFSEEYRDSEVKRNITALTTQLLMDIDGQLGDLLFPVYACVKYDMENSALLREQLSNIVLDVGKTEEHFSEKILADHICWMYKGGFGGTEQEKISDKNRVRGWLDEDFYLADLEQMKIYMWLSKMSNVVCVSMEHLLGENAFQREFWCELFYKGILVEHYRISSGENLVEYIDILGGQRGRKLIQLSRDGLTPEGENYVREEVMPMINRQLLKVLKELAGLKYISDTGEMCSFSERVSQNFSHAITKRIQPGKHGENIWKKQLLGISLFYNFYEKEVSGEEKPFMSNSFKEERRQWVLALRRFSRHVYKRKMDENILELSGLFSVTEAYINLSEGKFAILRTRKMSLAEIMDRSNKLLVISVRRTQNDKWANALVLLSEDRRISDAEMVLSGKDVIKKEMTEDITEAQHKLINLLEKEDRGRNIENNRDLLEEWGNFMIQSFKAEPLNYSDSDRIFWLMETVPIRACFMDAEGNFKIHVLSGNDAKGVFYDWNSMHRIMKEMGKRHQEAEGKRFAGNAWRGFEFIGAKECPTGACSVKESYMKQNMSWMIYPCNGEAAVRIESFIQEPEYLDEIQITSSDGEEKVLPVRKWQKLLSTVADEMYSCLAPTGLRNPSEMSSAKASYQKYREESEDLLSYRSYIEKVLYHYSFFIQWAWSIWNEGFKEPVDGEIEEFQDALDNFSSKMGDFEKLHCDLICKAFQSAKLLLDGNFKEFLVDAESVKPKVWKLFSLIMEWKRLWEYLETTETVGNFDEIRRKYWDKTAEKANLIAWTAKKTGGDERSVEECYEQVWETLKNMALYHRRQVARKNFYNHKLLDWFETKG